MKELQVENGGYTRIVNKVIEELIKIPFKGKELNVCLFIIRKTWGYQKKEDQISLTQFEKALNLSRVSIIKALKNLELVKLVILVGKGNSRKSANIYSFNKYFESWELVKLPKLVKGKRSTSKGAFTITSKGGYTHKRKEKEKTKETTLHKRKDIKFSKDNYNEVIEAYKKLRGVELQGDEYKPILQAIKIMFKNGRTKDQIISFMQALSNSELDHWQVWTINTIKIKLPDYLGGQLTL